MNTANKYSAYEWRVYRNNRFIGYVIAASEIDAYRKAKEKYGDYVLVERVYSSLT